MRRSKHVEPLKNFGIINSITKLHLVGISTESSMLHGSMSIKREGTVLQWAFKFNIALAAAEVWHLKCCTLKVKI